ncbi:TM2 domain-containing protein [Acetatifactor aquisgranensis]|uniref:TM2 domain-containing protein n=1 Tax=Acetatifactor aquisgranensis TaxID=2941233 RepID=UPI00203EE4A9|nr:TM2 domain-containing protein [Acetatifactor aquisgranensis]
MKNRDSGKAKSGKAKREEVTMEEYLAAKAELDAVREEYGIRPKEGKISRAISNFFNKRDAKELRTVSRKKYLLLALFTGWMGGHRFYARQWVVAVLYLALFWTGFPLAMTIIDLMAAIPKEADKDGNICV